MEEKDFMTLISQEVEQYDKGLISKVDLCDRIILLIIKRRYQVTEYFLKKYGRRHNHDR